jgi:methylmalonyl-CoA mutase
MTCHRFCAQDMKDGDPASLIWHTPEGIDVKPLYTKDDTASLTISQVPGGVGPCGNLVCPLPCDSVA